MVSLSERIFFITNVINWSPVNIIRYDLDPLNDWKVKLECFTKVPDKQNVKAVVICNPSNPTGSVYDKEHIENILNYVKLYFPKAVVIADQIYEDVVFDPGYRFIDMGPIGKRMSLPVVTLSGIAKGFHAPGWRLGWIVSFGMSEEFKKRVHNLSAR